MKSRLGPASPDHWSEPVREVLDGLQPAADSATGKGPPNILYTIAHHPVLLPSFLGFTATLATRGVLERRDSELLALRTSLNCRSAFEWGHHVEYGLAAGLEPKELGAIANGPEDPSWSPRDRSLLRACDELHAHQQISDQTYDAVSAELSEAQIVELTFVIGNYTMLSMVANATGVPLEERLPAMPGTGSPRDLR
ncbi:MAG: carboxymuconolactone decarboxylase family protein [Myxococcales bacterium]